jgi:prepilin-type processing-associated H-X9-DG protein
VSVLRDLTDNAKDGRPGTNGHSYEVLGEVHKTNKVTQQFVNTYTLTGSGIRPGPSAFWLIHDSDDAGTNNKWDPADNHSDAGGNVVYCDGHASWVPNKNRDHEWKITRDSGS